MSDGTTWRKHLEGPEGCPKSIFGDEFLDAVGSRLWSPSEPDRKAASQLYNQLISRILTHRLSYQAGVESTALKSIYSLFERTRQIVDDNYGCTHFESLAWHVLNEHVRPFQAKWHRRSEAGLLNALDTTDLFRAELAGVQRTLSSFVQVLLDIRGDAPDGRVAARSARLNAYESEVKKEVNRTLRWGIPRSTIGRDAKRAQEIETAEAKHISKRRKHYGLPEVPHVCGLALSGGGIRSATFSVGVLVALAGRNLLPRFDFLSTVSGGGYIGSFLTAYLSESETIKLENTSDEPGLKADQEPFRRAAGEARALRFVRHRCRYLLLASSWLRLRFAVAQAYGMVLNALTVILCVGAIAIAEQGLRAFNGLDSVILPAAIIAAVALAATGVLLPLAARCPRLTGFVETVAAVLALCAAALFGWELLGDLHAFVGPPSRTLMWCAAAGGLPILASIILGLAGRRLGPFQLALTIVAALAVPVSLLTLELIFFAWLNVALDAPSPLSSMGYWITWAVGVAAVVAFCGLDINFTSPHRFYRNRLAEAFLVKRHSDGTVAQLSPKQLALSKASCERAPYQLINCALNVPGSKNPAMQGRLADFFLMSPSFTGSPLTGYRATEDWEAQNPGLDLATAMAVSGAAAAPQMGILTNRRFSFWLALLNVRLGLWLRRPDRYGGKFFRPGLLCLWREMLGTASEQAAYVNVSDGGHIENLGVYELLRRRCKFIVSVDGEHDPTMTFHGLTTLQRLAAIDLGIDIEFDLDDLRLNGSGFSRSHFRFARIRYPAIDGFEEGIGYILYFKLSLTGNEGEFIRRYRLDEPAFPHHSTANQLFDETQYEAYRALGEHVGDKLFLEAIVGRDLAKSEDVSIEDLFTAIAVNFLEPDNRVQRKGGKRTDANNAKSSGPPEAAPGDGRLAPKAGPAAKP